MRPNSSPYTVLGAMEYWVSQMEQGHQVEFAVENLKRLVGELAEVLGLQPREQRR